MLELLLFILTSYGICNIIVFGSIFEGLRNFTEKINPKGLGKLFSCMICLPFWSGVVLALIGFSPLLSLTTIIDISVFGWFVVKVLYIKVFLSGCLSSGSVWLVHTIQEKLEYRLPEAKKEE